MHRTRTIVVAGLIGALATGGVALSAAAASGDDVDRAAACRQAVVHADMMVSQQAHVDGTSTALEIARDMAWESKVDELEPKLAHMRETVTRTLVAYQAAAADCR